MSEHARRRAAEVHRAMVRELRGAGIWPTHEPPWPISGLPLDGRLTCAGTRQQASLQAAWARLRRELSYDRQIAKRPIWAGLVHRRWGGRELLVTLTGADLSKLLHKLHVYEIEIERLTSEVESHGIAGNDVRG
jgi:hypothetical protein